MLGFTQSHGDCPCPTQEQLTNGVTATPAADGGQRLQGRPMCPPQTQVPPGPMVGRTSQLDASTQPRLQPQGFPGYGARPAPPQQPQAAYPMTTQGQTQQAPPAPQQAPPPYLEQQVQQVLNTAIMPQGQLPAPQPGAIQVIVMGEPNEFLAHWLSTNNLEWRRAIDSYDVDVSRNRATREFLAFDVPRGKRYMMMIDADMVPCGETLGMIQAAGDLVYCGHTGAQGGRGHSGPGNMAAACMRVSVRCLQAMAKVTQGVWWNMGKNPGRSVRTHCECAYFNAIAQKAGVMPQQVGIIGHMQTCIVFPVNDSPTDWKLFWPAQYRQMVPRALPASQQSQ